MGKNGQKTGEQNRILAKQGKTESFTETLFGFGHPWSQLPRPYSPSRTSRPSVRLSVCLAVCLSIVLYVFTAVFPSLSVRICIAITMEGDATGLAPVQVLVHGAGLGHEGLQLIEAGVHAPHHGM